MALLETFIILASLIVFVYIWLKRHYSYWQRRGIPYVEPTFFIGNTKETCLQQQSFSLQISDIYNAPHVADEAVVGIYAFHKPGLVIRDPELIKAILIKDFNKFNNRYATSDPHNDPLGSYNLFFVKNPAWKELRTKLSPVFTSGKLKQLYSLMQEIGCSLEKHLWRLEKQNESFVCEVKDTFSLFSTDVIASIAFGIQANSLENPNAEFRQQGRDAMNFNFRRFFNFFAVFFMPKMVSIVRAKLFDKKFADFIRNTVNYVMTDRQRTGTVRNDLIDTLLAMKKEAVEDKTGTLLANNNDYLAAQALVFFTAGFETTAATMGFALYELAKNPLIQERLRTEINEAFVAEEGKISYEKLNSLEYLGMVVDEVLRLYPIMPFLDRVYEKQPNEQDFSLKPYYDYELNDGTPVFIPVFAIQRDAKYWDDPEKFDPERFSSENKKNQKQMTYIPFGSGPHNCIGMRFGLLQSKVGIVHFLKNYYVRPCEDTTKEIKFSPKQPNLQFLNGISLEVIKDNLYDKSV